MSINWQFEYNCCTDFSCGFLISENINHIKGGTLEIRDKYDFKVRPFESESDWEKLRD